MYFGYINKVLDEFKIFLENCSGRIFLIKCFIRVFWNFLFF